MRTLLLFILLLPAVHIHMSADTDPLLKRLDAAIARRPTYLQHKEAGIDSLKKALLRTSSDRGKFDLLNQLYDQYLTYNFDSTMRTVERAEVLARRMDDADACATVKINKALSLATSGHFSEAMAILRGIDSAALAPATRIKYFSACEWALGVWAEYSHDTTFAPRYKHESILYLDSLLAVMPSGSAEYLYRSAEKALRSSDFGNAEKLYLKAVSQFPENSRLYAQCAYALALTYKELGNDAKYREWLIRAAISDQITPLKENLALQQLALYLKNNEGDEARANRYLRLSLEDAIFYNNRLRLLEIAEKFPQIAIEYQDKINSQNKDLKTSLFCILFLLVAMSATIWQLVRQIKKRRRAIDEKERLALQLTDTNRKLMATNRSREQYTGLFLDLCGTYIEKLNHFPLVLKLKVKHLSDLNSVADRYIRPSEAEIREMFFNYDTAFLRLYPDFISRFNALLRPDCQILPKGRELLNTDLRIYSLVRMGITDSNRIASLLFYSPQTIFNHRTSVRNRAINRDTFEHDVREICRITDIPADRAD